MSDKKKTIGVKLTIEGFHNFPNAIKAFGKSIDFLQVRHRHNFGIEVEVEVSHNERDKEFILFKREIQSHIEANFGNPAEFGGMSCESIAEHLFDEFNAVCVTVDEDGENYSRVRKI